MSVCTCDAAAGSEGVLVHAETVGAGGGRLGHHHALVGGVHAPRVERGRVAARKIRGTVTERSDQRTGCKHVCSRMGHQHQQQFCTARGIRNAHY